MISLSNDDNDVPAEFGGTSAREVVGGNERRRTYRPIRPNPLIPMLIDMSKGSEAGCRKLLCCCKEEMKKSGFAIINRPNRDLRSQQQRPTFVLMASEGEHVCRHCDADDDVEIWNRQSQGVDVIHRLLWHLELCFSQ